MTYKPVDTAIIMVVGPCIDDTDFKTLEEAIAYNAAGMDVSLIVEKTDGTTAVTAITLTTGGTSDWTHKDGGYYEIEVTAAQNAEEGIAFVRGVCTGVLPFESIHYNVVKANIYDSWIKGTDVLQTDVTQWLGTAAATPTVAGVPEVDLTHINGGTGSVGNLKDLVDNGFDSTNNRMFSDITAIVGDTTSITDLKDLVDTGYDPVNHKVQGVLLVDTTTINTDMVGTDNAALAATALTNVTWTDLKAGYITGTVALQSVCTENRLAELDAANLPTDIADIPTVAEFEARTIAAANYVVTTDTIAGVTTVTNLTNAPTNGDLTATMKTSVNDQVVDVIKTDTTAEMSQGAPPATPTFEEMVAYLYFKMRNKQETTSTEDAIYDDAGTTKLFKSVFSEDGSKFSKQEYGTGA